MANQVGRPLKFVSVAQVAKLIDDYFIKCDKYEKPYTITGLALALDTNRETLLDYEEKDEYSDTIKRAKMKCHNYAEEYLYNGKNVTGAIFNLKNNYGWKDKTEQELSNPDGTLNPYNALTAEELRKLAGK